MHVETLPYVLVRHSEMIQGPSSTFKVRLLRMKQGFPSNMISAQAQQMAPELGLTLCRSEQRE